MTRLLAAVFSLIVVGAGDFKPGRFSGGPVPLPLQQTVGRAEVFLEVSVSAAGTVYRIEMLRAVEPLAGVLRAAVAQWTFEPAMQDGEAIESQILVAAVYRPATLFNTPGLGAPPKDLAQASERIPFPTSTPAPSYPPTALGNGVVLVEALVGPDGGVRTATALRSSGRSFDSSAIQSAVRWRFRPARRSGSPVPAVAYLVFGFRQPIVPATRPR